MLTTYMYSVIGIPVCEVRSSLRLVSVLCSLTQLVRPNVVTLLIGEAADCEGSDQSCHRVGWRAAGLLLLTTNRMSVFRSGGQEPQRLLRRRNALTRWCWLVCATVRSRAARLSIVGRIETMMDATQVHWSSSVTHSTAVDWFSPSENITQQTSSVF